MGHFLQRLRDCRLCWTLTRYVFLLILIVESVILLPSVYNFRNNALQALEQRAVFAVQAVLPQAQKIRDLRRLEQDLQVLRGRHGIAGLSVRLPDGVALAPFGETPFDGLLIEEGHRSGGPVFRRNVPGGLRHDIAWTESVGNQPVTFLARLDSSQIGTEVMAFVLRVAGLVAIIVLVVTLGTMLLVNHIVLSPILRLRQSMLAASDDPDNADNYMIHETARDELADVFAAHNEMLQNVAKSKLLDRSHAEEQARFLAKHDPLTGLPNREYFLERLHQALARSVETGALIHGLVLNLAGFRSINDALGQHIGDRVLLGIANRLGELLGPGRFVARLGGDEFGILDTASSAPVQAAQLAERILACVEQPLAIGEHGIRLRGRIGIACVTGADMRGKSVLHDAQVALNLLRKEADISVKYRFFSPDMMHEVRRRQETERELREALDHGQLHLFFQPKFSLVRDDADAVFSSCEALIRWKHPVRGWIMPGEFIRVAEDCGLIVQIGEWALRGACAQIRRWRESGYVAPRVAVNISAQQFQDATLPEVISGFIAEAGIDPGALSLEITETAAMADAQLSVSVLASLRRIGVRLAIDDFGTGYSSLSYLRQFDIDAIKIDKSFIDDIGNPNADAVCVAMIHLGHSLGQSVVAEGVETRAQLDFLRLNGCDEAQGNWFARPMPAEEMFARLAKIQTP